MRKEGESAKSINEMLLSRLSRYRASPSATLAALTGSTISNTLKEDQAGQKRFTFHFLTHTAPILVVTDLIGPVKKKKSVYFLSLFPKYVFGRSTQYLLDAGIINPFAELGL